MPHAFQLHLKFRSVSWLLTFLISGTGFMRAQPQTVTPEAMRQRSVAEQHGFYQLVLAENHLAAQAGASPASVTAATRAMLESKLGLSSADAGPVLDSLSRISPGVAILEGELVSLRQRGRPAAGTGGQNESPGDVAQHEQVRALLRQRNALVAGEFRRLQGNLDSEAAARVETAILARFFPLATGPGGTATKRPGGGPMMLSGSGRAVPATLAQMYRYAFHFQNSMEQRAAERQKAGESGAPFQDVLRVRFGLTTRQFEGFRTASAEFNRREQILRSGMREELNSGRAAAASSRGQEKSLPQQPSPRLTILSAGIRSAASTQVDAIRGKLEPAASQKLNADVQAFYLDAQQTLKGKTTHTGPEASPALSPVGGDDDDDDDDDDDGGPGGCSTPYTYTTLTFTSDGGTAVGYSEADISDYDYYNGCFAAVEGQLSESGNILQDYVETSYDVEADLSLQTPVSVGNLYAEFTIGASCDYYGYCTTQNDMASHNTGAPNIQSVTPSSGMVNTSPTLTVRGSFLTGAGAQPSVSAGGSGLSVSVAQATASNVQLNATIDSTASAGTDSITLTTVWGSTSANFTVTCDTPQITGVSPSNLNVGQTAGVTMTGSGFCNGSVVTATSPGGVVLYGATVLDSADISATIVVPNNDSTETATVTVTNPNGGSSSYPVSVVGQQSGQIYLLNPYRLASAANPNISTDLIINLLSSPGNNAQGIVADGISTAIVVFVTDSPQTVTFNSTNGATLTPYDSSFLTDNLWGDQTSMPIVPIPQGNAFYAIALLRSGTSGFGLTTTVSVGSISTGMLTVSPPVVLVHGLWGSQSSLSYLQNYLTTLTPQFGFYPYLNHSICYSPFLAFDATTDGLPGSGAGCEFTSTSALDQYLNDLYSSLDGSGFVGGSVNLVGHSMGGLVARNYSTTGNYNSIRNRMQGAFRQVITIDTPESGSDLATWLDTVGYNRTLQRGITEDFDAYAMWQAICNFNSGLDLQTCFANKNLPLAAPGQPLSTGAVYSLIPNGSSLVGLPNPQIPNANWHAIASDFQDGTSPGSALRSFLNTVIRATYPVTQSAPDLSSILGTPDSDAIVTVDSQAGNWTGAWTQFCNLSHAPLPVLGAMSSLDGLSNDNVTNSDLVNNQVASWLGYPAAQSANCYPSSAPSPPSPPPDPNPPSPDPPPDPSPDPELPAPQVARAGVAAKLLYAAPERLAATLPVGRIALGQPVELPVRLQTGRILSLTVEQRDPVSHQAFANEVIDQNHQGPRSHVLTGAVSDDGTSRMLNTMGNAQSIQIIPQQAGPLDLILTAHYADGGYATQTYRIQVAPSAKDVSRFLLNWAPRMALVLDGSSQDQTSWLRPRVDYKTLKLPIYLGDSKLLKLRIEQPAATPVVKVDSDGKIHALHAGTATIVGDFDGIQDKVVVTVYSRDHAPAGYIFHAKP